MNKPHAISGNGCHDSWSLLVSHFVAHLRYDALSYPSAIKSAFSLILFNIPSKYLHQTGFWLTISHYHRVYFYHLQPVVIDQSWVESPVLPSFWSANFPWKVELSGEPYRRHRKQESILTPGTRRFVPKHYVCMKCERVKRSHIVC